MGNRQGFTLLELVLAMAILGTVVLVALGAFRIGQRAWEKGDAVAIRNQRLRIAAERIRQQLSAASVYIDPGRDAGALGLTGDAEMIRFVSRISMIPDQEMGLVLVHYRVFDTPDQGRVLGFHEQPVVTLDLPPYDEPGYEDYHPLILGLSAAVWEYREGQGAEAAIWRDAWDAGDHLALPEAVRLSLRSGEDPPLFVFVRIVNPTGN